MVRSADDRSSRASTPGNKTPAGPSGRPGVSTFPQRVDAVILAGAENRGRLHQSSPASYEALIPIKGRPMVSYVVDALTASSRVGTVVLVGPEEELLGQLGEAASASPAGSVSAGDGRGRMRIVPMGAGMLENLERGLAATSSPLVLVSTSDVPLLTPAVVEDFLKRCEALGPADVYYAVVPKESNDARYPEVRRTYIRLRDGVVTGGNLFLVNPDAVRRARALLGQAIEARKDPLRLARLLGFGYIVRLLLGRLTAREVEERVGRMLGIVGRAVWTPHPEVGIDVDKPSDLDLARRVLGEKAADGV